MPNALADRETGLEWALAPTAGRSPWAAAHRALAAEGWRLPSVGELMGLLSSLPPSLADRVAVGDVLWSESNSPFAPRSAMRAVVCDGPERFGVVLLDRAQAARCWGVRERGRQARPS